MKTKNIKHFGYFLLQVALLVGGFNNGFAQEKMTKQYELKNHLGNVLTVISNEKDEDGNAVVVSANDYYPFGMTMPGRSYNSSEYRYGFGGHEKDNEIKGSENHLSFGDYGYDPRLGRRWNIDPIEQIGISGYSVFNNNPIFYIDPNGESPISIFAKLAFKKGLKKASKEFVETQIKKRLKVYMGKKGARKWAGQLADDAMKFVDYATSTSYMDYFIEVIPFIGDAYGASKLGKQGYRVWDGLKKFDKIAELGSKGAKNAWKALGSNSGLTGKGADALQGWINKVNNNFGHKLNDNTIAGAIKEKFGLNSGFKPDGRPYNHLNSLQDRMKGIKNQIADLQKQIDDGVFENDTLKAAKGVLNAAKSQHNNIENLMKSVENTVSKIGKVYD